MKIRLWNPKTKRMFVQEIGNENETPLRPAGFADLEGKEVYEGDILEDLYENRAEVVPLEDDQIVSGLTLKGLNPNKYGFSVFYTSWIQRAKVIGNRYENPELLKRK